MTIASEEDLLMIMVRTLLGKMTPQTYQSVEGNHSPVNEGPNWIVSILQNRRGRHRDKTPRPKLNVPGTTLESRTPMNSCL